MVGPTTDPQPRSSGGDEPTPETLTDKAAEAFTAYRSGHSPAMGRLVDLLTPLLWHTARAQGLSPAAAEDVCQTAWLRLIDRCAAIDEPRAVLSWMVTTVRREAWRQHKVANRDNGDLAARPEPSSPDPGPETEALLAEQQRVLWNHVGQLNDRCQHLLRVIAFADRPDYATIANSLKMPVGSIGPTRGRCLTQLRDTLALDPSWLGELS